VGDDQDKTNDSKADQASNSNAADKDAGTEGAGGQTGLIKRKRVNKPRQTKQQAAAAGAGQTNQSTPSKS